MYVHFYKFLNLTFYLTILHFSNFLCITLVSAQLFYIGFKALTTKVIISHLGRIIINLSQFHPLFKMEKTCATQKGTSWVKQHWHFPQPTHMFFFFNVTLIIYCQFEQIFKYYSNLFKRAKCLHANFFQEKKNPSSLELKIKFLKCFWGYPFLFCVFSSLSTPFLLSI